MRTIMAHLHKYYGGYLVIVALLGLILWFPNRAVNRYAISTDTESYGVWIVDTRTGQSWYRSRRTIVDWGTVTKPQWTLNRLNVEGEAGGRKGSNGESPDLELDGHVRLPESNAPEKGLRLDKIPGN